LIATDGIALRKQFGISSNSKIILRGIGTDPPLERYWEFRRVDDLPQQFTKLDPLMVIGPNFSHFLDVPRTDNLFNRKRQLICLDEMTQARLNPVPHLNATQPGDWKFWKRFLTECANIRYVAIEFETGNKTRSEGIKVIDHLSSIQDSLTRPLHPLVVGGTQFVEEIGLRFTTATFIDSTPFVKAMHRQKLTSGSEKLVWNLESTAPSQGVDGILDHNIESYAKWIEYRWLNTKKQLNHKENKMGGRISLELSPP
jgi:hypothetical protein